MAGLPRICLIALSKFHPTGRFTTIAQAEPGMTGTIALAFGRGDRRTSLYVVTSGSMSYPPPTGLETAKVVRLEVDQEGLLLCPL